MSSSIRTLAIAATAALVLIGTAASLERAAAFAQAQAPSRATVTGTVVDAALAPLAGVIVTLEQQGRMISRATTNAEGAFVLTGIAPGAYQVRVAHTGYPAFAKALTVTARATTVRLPIVLVRPEDRARDAAAQEAQAGSVAMRSVAGGMAGGGGRGGAAGPPPGSTGAQGTLRTRTPTVATTTHSDFVQTLPRADRYPPGFLLPGETYAEFSPNRFHATLDRPLSTFGADVDTASYSNIRRFLSSGQLPPAEAVRVEEMINYFRFDYAAPRGPHPIALTTEIGDCPWAPGHKLRE
jgi:Ca-activated chloride channel family protein